MPVTLKVLGSNETLVAERKAVAESVLSIFGELPALKLLCFFDDKNADGLRHQYGATNRGGFTPVDGTFCCPPWPTYVWSEIFVQSEKDFWATKQLYEALIYLHGSTCESKPALVMTFAHELQHFMQSACHKRLWAISTAAFHNFPADVFEWAKIRVFDVPIETEARITSKRIAEALCKPEELQRYIDDRISDAPNENEAADWRFIKGLDSSMTFNLNEKTLSFFERLKPYRTYLEADLQRLRTSGAFKDIDFAALL